jgi:hypothetical protein
MMIEQKKLVQVGTRIVADLKNDGLVIGRKLEAFDVVTAAIPIQGIGRLTEERIDIVSELQINAVWVWDFQNMEAIMSSTRNHFMEVVVMVEDKVGIIRSPSETRLLIFKNAWIIEMGYNANKLSLSSKDIKKRISRISRLSKLDQTETQLFSAISMIMDVMDDAFNYLLWSRKHSNEHRIAWIRYKALDFKTNNVWYTLRRDVPLASNFPTAIALFSS